jgi:serine/threonine protein kinase
MSIDIDVLCKLQQKSPIKSSMTRVLLGEGAFGKVTANTEPDKAGKGFIFTGKVSKAFINRDEFNSENKRIQAIIAAANANTEFEKILQKYTLILREPTNSRTGIIKYKQCDGMEIGKYVRTLSRFDVKTQQGILKEIFMMTANACLNVLVGMRKYCEYKLHCDLGMRNIMYCEEQGVPGIKIIDFGISHQLYCEYDPPFRRTHFSLNPDERDYKKMTQAAKIQDMEIKYRFTATDVWKEAFKDAMTFHYNQRTSSKISPLYKDYMQEDMFALGLVLSIIYTSRFPVITPFDTIAHEYVQKLLKSEFVSTEKAFEEFQKLTNSPHHAGTTRKTTMKYIKTSLIHMSNKVKRVVYDKDGKHYVRRLNKQTGKMKYFPVKSGVFNMKH